MGVYLQMGDRSYTTTKLNQFHGKSMIDSTKSKYLSDIIRRNEFDE